MSMEKTIAGKKSIEPTPMSTPILKIAEPGCELLYKFNILYHTHIIKELISRGAEKKFHDGNREVTSRKDIPGRKFAFPNSL
jgi:hypothetical protein